MHFGDCCPRVRTGGMSDEVWEQIRDYINDFELAMSDNRFEADKPDKMELIQWLTDEQLDLIYTSKYWNDVETEKLKEWWIADGNYEVCLEYLRSSQLLSEYQEAEKEILRLNRGSLDVADLAAGIGWTSALLSRLDCVRTVHAVEISKHRIGSLFEHCVVMLSGNPGKLKRYLGSFYETKFQNESLDLIVLSQAFHHAENPLKLLTECNRILKPHGTVLITGEHFIGVMEIFRRFLSCLVKNRKFVTNFRELFPSDPILGDNFYKVSDYLAMFSSFGMKGRLVKLQSGNAMYVVTKL